MRKGDRKRMGPADSNKDAEDGRRARVTLSLFGIVMLGIGLLVVFGGLSAGGGSGDDTTAMAESNETEIERNDTEEPRDNETETTETKTETNNSTEAREEMNETEANETAATEESTVNETPDTTGSDIDMIEPESEDSEPSAERESGQEFLGHL